MSKVVHRFATSWIAALLWAGLSLAALAQAEDEDRIPPLRPPKAELPPGWWEQNGIWVIAGALVSLTLVVAAALIYFRLRRPPAAEPLKRAHQELEPLLDKPENGVVLTHVSQAVKGYFQSAFPLPEGEMTTTEFCQAVDADTQIGPELGATVSEFLHRCDQKKFAPAAPPGPLNAAHTALNLVDTGERRRIDLARKAEEARQA